MQDEQLIADLRARLAGYVTFFDPMSEVYWVAFALTPNMNTSTKCRIIVPSLRGTQNDNYVGIYELSSLYGLVYDETYYIRHDLDLLPTSDYSTITVAKPSWVDMLDDTEAMEWFVNRDVEMRSLPAEVYEALERDKNDWDLAQRIKKAYMK